ncbi:7-cyano-7-deazaguanine synthase [Allopseudospirillum japonicum]|uniref:7-cyano-7-deazaguanine synthase n=1 Tax=Allopseudospirillum japonicum TaxID=64971 RepID=A0A1H6TVG2_9GAMM|nr:7-cyano-7-deazaguanine synthase QueC [Allopseudospirillum japonicum]SEI83206.1 7-cyano-7-deazaguanine synthase [Allopseudospirillum japonicum]
MNARKAVVIYSGGMDSFTLLHQVIQQGYQVYPVSFDYGQRHARELAAAKHVCQMLNLPHQCIDLRSIQPLLDQSALTGQHPVPQGTYAPENLQITLVPNRNMILLSLAIAYAVNLGANECFYGAHGGDHVLYPDCRPEFVTGMDQMAQISNLQPVRIRAPFLHYDKADILRLGQAMHLDYALTWTCYQGAEQPCGTCSACHERAQAFAACGCADPLIG